MDAEDFSPDDRFEEANQVLHKVETQWHHPIMTKYGFVPLDLEARGFVRNYTYARGFRRIRVSTGVFRDYWEDLNELDGGMWMDLEPHLKSLPP
jgi:hypothetical protein